VEVIVMTELLSTEEAARRLDVTPGTLMVWRCTKRYPLKFIRIGRKVRYRAADVEEFLKERTVSGVAEQDSGRRSVRVR
jgi:excisionase family DNA binding protein